MKSFPTQLLLAFCNCKSVWKSDETLNPNYYHSNFMGPLSCILFGVAFGHYFQNLFLKNLRYKNENWEQVSWSVFKNRVWWHFGYYFQLCGTGAVYSHIKFRPLELSFFWLLSGLGKSFTPPFPSSTLLTHLSEPTYDHFLDFLWDPALKALVSVNPNVKYKKNLEF